MAVGDFKHLVVGRDRCGVVRRILRDERDAFSIRTPGILVHALQIIGYSPRAATLYRRHENLDLFAAGVFRQEREARTVGRPAWRRQAFALADQRMPCGARDVYE